MADEDNATVIVTVDGVDALMKKFDTLETQLIELRGDLVREFTDWQLQDMKRRYPTVDDESSGGEATVATNIYPRSRLKRARAAAKSQGRATRRRARAAVGRAGSSRRPILRPELFKSLVERMTVMVEDAMKWP
jgi:hypothetical protein